MSNLPGDEDKSNGDFDNSTVFCKHGFEIGSELSVVGFIEVILLMAIGAVPKIGIGFDENPGGGLETFVVAGICGLNSLPGGGVDNKGPFPLVFEVLLLSGFSLSVVIF